MSKRKHDDDGDAGAPESKRPKGPTRRAPVVRECPYLDTVNRHLLDFDFEKLCCVSLSDLNVYGCLVCGRYFQGRGQTSHAYYHAMDASHYVFINLKTMKVYCLPDGYEVFDTSMDDIKRVLHPRFAPDQLMKVIGTSDKKRTLDGGEYLPGMVGLNNVKQTDWLNVVMQALARVPTLRDYFCLRDNNAIVPDTPLVVAFGELIRKMWNPHLFKGQVSPHELLQAVSGSSKKKFQSGKLSDPMDFITWLLNNLHTDLGGTKSAGSSVIHEAFQGEVFVTTETAKDIEEADRLIAEGVAASVKSTTKKVPFLQLSLDVPPAPLFQDQQLRNIIPQEPLFNLMSKFDGQTKQDMMNGNRLSYIINKLPRYLIVTIRRFQKNNFFLEKNPTIVTFPVRNLDLQDYCTDECKEGTTQYNLIANIVHEGEPGKGIYKAHVYHRGKNQWFEAQDLMISETMPQVIAQSEAYMQIYERADAPESTAGVPPYVADVKEEDVEAMEVQDGPVKPVAKEEEEKKKEE